MRKLQQDGFAQLVTRGRSELDLRNAAGVDRFFAEEKPALNPLPVLDYWGTVRARFANPHIDYRLSQIAEDGALKLAERIFPLMVANAGTGAPIRSLARIVRAWLDSAYGETHAQSALDDPTIFPPPIRENASLRAAILEAVA